MLAYFQFVQFLIRRFHPTNGHSVKLKPQNLRPPLLHTLSRGKMALSSEFLGDGTVLHLLKMLCRSPNFRKEQRENC